MNREATPTEAIDDTYVSGLTPSDPDLLRQHRQLVWRDPATNHRRTAAVENGPHGIVHLVDGRGE